MRCEGCQIPIGIGTRSPAHVTSLGEHCEKCFLEAHKNEAKEMLARRAASRMRRSQAMKKRWQEGGMR